MKAIATAGDEPGARTTEASKIQVAQEAAVERATFRRRAANAVKTLATENKGPSVKRRNDDDSVVARRLPRPGSKLDRVLGLLRAETGATLAELIAATGWLPHSARAVLTSLRKRGYHDPRTRRAGRRVGLQGRRFGWRGKAVMVMRPASMGASLTGVQHNAQLAPEDTIVSSSRDARDAQSTRRQEDLRAPTPRAQSSEGSAPDASALQAREQLAHLQTLNGAALREEWRRRCRSEPPRISRDLLVRALGYRIQELLFGGLPKWAAWRLAGSEEGFEGDEGAPAPIEPRLKPGARLVREWHGRAHSVIALDDGFEFEGRRYRSLTQIAHAITGARWSGPRFFGLADRRAGRERSEGRGRTGALREDPIDDGADERERENAMNARASPHANGGRRSASLASGGGGRA